MDAQTKTVLEMMAASPLPKMNEVTPAEARAQLEAVSATLDIPPPDVGSVEDRTIPGPAGEIPIRIYRPEGAAGPRPALVYFHGGGFVVGSLNTHDPLCRSLTKDAGVVTISIDYRLAPEHPFPAAVEDAEAAIRWVAANAATLGIDPARIAVGGDSAGGNLTAVACQLLRDADGPNVAFQLLIYPAVGTLGRGKSMQEFAEGYFLEADLMNWFFGQYLPDLSVAATDRRVSPILTEDLSDLPPAFILTAEYDPLRDDGHHYGELLAAAGVPTEVKCYDGTIHGFLSFAGAIDLGRDGIGECARRLREALHAGDAAA